ncbi:MAG: hypothetical protein HY319_13315 [Armatimonadetes bacterium]|nr:hypothetical protein [Armatimonadota bacterium]
MKRSEEPADPAGGVDVDRERGRLFGQPGMVNTSAPPAGPPVGSRKLTVTWMVAPGWKLVSESISTRATGR